MIQDLVSSFRSRIPEGFQNATYQWVCSRRGRVTIVSGILLLTIVGLLSHTSTEALSSYTSLSSFNPAWSPSLSSYDSQSPLLTPTKTALELESGSLQQVPNHLKKGNPSFHVLLPDPEVNVQFCKATLSGMLLNYPPPTMIKGEGSQGTEQAKHKGKIRSTWLYLKNKIIKDDDIVMIVDGNNVWFQLPSDVLVREYEAMITEANTRLQKQYGLDSDGKPRYQQTTIWGAMKRCPNPLRDEPACKAVPDSPLPTNLYGDKTDSDPEGLLHRPKYLNSGAVIGKAKDLRAIFEHANDIVTAYEKANKDNKAAKVLTYHMALSSIFGEQEYARSASTSAANANSWKSWLANKVGHEETANNTDTNVDSNRRYEFSMGLDYGSMLFQSTTPSAPNEFDVVRYDTDPAKAPPFPIALAKAQPPFADSSPVDALSPNKKHLPYIEELRPTADLDLLPSATSTWANVSLIVNTYNPSLPAAFYVTPDGPSTLKALGSKKARAAKLNVWESLWFKPMSRALLRRYLRTASQGVMSFHNMAVGGDRAWDTRGGAGGVWDNKGHWMEWGIEICEGEAEEVFGDGKGKWLKEHEQPGQKAKKREAETEEHRIRKRDMYQHEGIQIA